MSLSLVALLACTGDDASDVKNGASDDTTEEESGPYVPTWGDDVAIAPSDRSSQAEPTAVGLPDGTVVAAWMDLSASGELYIKYARSEDSGKTWSDSEVIDRDGYAYQNDPVLIADGNTLYFTWLAVEYNNNSQWTNIYCSSSTDGGKTWSDRVPLTTGRDFKDRQWMAAHDGHLVMSYDFIASYMQQYYVESDDGCEGFGDADLLASGSFLNGVPTIEDDGSIWTARANYTFDGVEVVVGKKDGRQWDESSLMTYAVNYGSNLAIEETEEIAEGVEELRERREAAEEGEHQPLVLSDGLRFALGEYLGTHTAVSDGNFDGVYSPVLNPRAGGGVNVVAPITEEDDDTEADIWFMSFDGNDVDTQMLSSEESPTPQLEPWLVTDKWGGLHATWFDAGEGQWRLVGASSIDGGETWTTAPVGDHTFRKGFAEDSMSDAFAWVGHFQALTTTDDAVVAVFGSSHENNISKLYADAGQRP